jgi:cytochrome P450
MAVPLGGTAEELQKALEKNHERLERASAFLTRLARAEDWHEWAETYERIDALLDERIALRRTRL